MTTPGSQALPEDVIPISILVCDDHSVVRSGLRAAFDLEPALRVVGEASSAAEALERATVLSPDVVIMDMRLPDASGAWAMREIHRRCPRTRSLVLSSYDQSSDVLGAIEAGASGFLVKTASITEIIEAVKDVVRGLSHMDKVAAARLLQQVHSPDSSLTTEEVGFLRLVAEGLEYADVARQRHMAESTVKKKMAKICRKLGANNRTAAVAEAMRRGDLRLR